MDSVGALFVIFSIKGTLYSRRAAVYTALCAPFAQRKGKDYVEKDIG